VPNDTAAGPHRIERVLVTAAATVLGLSVLALIVVLVLAATGVQLGGQAFAVLTLLPLIGMPIGVLLIIAFMVAVGTRRSRESRDARG
jgi:hypothetical protein